MAAAQHPTPRATGWPQHTHDVWILGLRVASPARDKPEGVSVAGKTYTRQGESEAESLDRFYQVERGVFVNPDAATQRLLDTLNGSTVEGQREIYEVIV